MGNVGFSIKSVRCILWVKVFLKILSCYVCAIKQKEVKNEKCIKRIRSQDKEKRHFSAIYLGCAVKAASCARSPDKQSPEMPGQKALLPPSELPGLFPKYFLNNLFSLRSCTH